MDAKFKSYVVMKAVEAIHGQRGRTSLIKMLRGSRGYGVEKMVEKFNLTSLWGIFSKAAPEEIADLLTTLMDKGFILVEDVKSGGYTYPMLGLSVEGRDLLSALEVTEASRIDAVRMEAWDARRSMEISEKGQELEEFLGLLAAFMALWNKQAHERLDVTGILDRLSPDYEGRERLEKFIYRTTPDKLKENWQTSYALDVTCHYIEKHLKLLLSALPELDAAVFRCWFKVEDGFYRTREAVLCYYSLPERELQGVLKRVISRFSSKGWVDRHVFIRLVMSLLMDKGPEEEASNGDLVKETAAVTYALYQQGLTLEEIARERSLAISTIYTHFVKLIPLHNIALQAIIPPDRLTAIQGAIHGAGSDSLKAVKEILPGDISYGEVKLVLELQNGWQAA